MKNGYTELGELAERTIREIIRTICDETRTPEERIAAAQAILKSYPQRKREAAAGYASAGSARQKGAVTCRSGM